MCNAMLSKKRSEAFHFYPVKTISADGKCTIKADKLLKFHCYSSCILMYILSLNGIMTQVENFPTKRFDQIIIIHLKPTRQVTILFILNFELSVDEVGTVDLLPMV